MIIILSIEKAKNVSARDVLSVGIPQAGENVGVFDQDENELSYNQRGELWVQSDSMMKAYYNKDELTAKTIRGQWLRTGDLAEIDKNGQVYVYGRIRDSICLNNGNIIFLFDLANRIKKEEGIDNALVLNRSDDEGQRDLLAHLVFNEDVIVDKKKEICLRLDSILRNMTNDELDIIYYGHNKHLPYSPTTYKLDRDKMLSMNDAEAIVYIAKWHE